MSNMQVCSPTSVGPACLRVLGPGFDGILRLISKAKKYFAVAARSAIDLHGWSSVWRSVGSSELVSGYIVPLLRAAFPHLRTGVIVASIIGVIVQAVKYLGRGAQQPSGIFEALETPLCAHCTPIIRTGISMPNATMRCRFLAPAGCGRCSILGDRWPRVRSFIDIDSTTHQVLVCFTQQKKIKPTRDIHGPLTNFVDGLPDQSYTTRVTNALLPAITELQRANVGLGRADRSWADCFMRASAFLPITSEDRVLSSPPSWPSPMLRRLREVWDFIDTHGSYPVQSVISGTRRVFNSVCAKPRNGADQPSPHAVMSDLSASSTQYAAPAQFEAVAHTVHPAAVVVGPVAVPVTVHDPRNVSRMTEGRSEVKLDPRTGEPLAFQPDSDVGKTVLRFFRILKGELFDDSTIDKAYRAVFGEKSLGEFGLSKFSPEQSAEAVGKMRLHESSMDAKLTRKAGGKWEQITKPGKVVRAVVDNGVEFLAMAYGVCAVFETIVFGHDSPFSRMSIKHGPRITVLDEFVANHSEPQVKGRDKVMWEIDQTNMETHQRSPGVLDQVYLLLNHVASRISHRMSGTLANKYKARIAYDQKRGMILKVALEDVRCIDGARNCRLQFPDMYLDSGWLLTSAVNFVDEFACTYSCLTLNPWHVFAKDRNKRYYICQQDRPVHSRELVHSAQKPCRTKFKPVFQARQFTLSGCEPAPDHIVLQGMFEGDDGAGSASSWLADPWIQEQVTWYAADIGYSAKFKVVKNGRVEFIGAHMVVSDGMTDRQIPWVPNVKSNIAKLGVHTQTRADTPDVTRQGIGAVRFLSLAENFEGRVEPLYMAFRKSAERLLSRGNNGKPLPKTLTVTTGDEYSEDGRVYGARAQVSPWAVYEAHMAKPQRPFPSPAVQQKMILNSIEVEQVLDEHVTILSQLGIYAQACGEDIDHQAAYLAMPRWLR